MIDSLYFFGRKGTVPNARFGYRTVEGTLLIVRVSNPKTTGLSAAFV
jgi:hypothetical protein